MQKVKMPDFREKKIIWPEIGGKMPKKTQNEDFGIFTRLSHVFVHIAKDDIF